MSVSVKMTGSIEDTRLSSSLILKTIADWFSNLRAFKHVELQSIYIGNQGPRPVCVTGLGP